MDQDEAVRGMAPDSRPLIPPHGGYRALRCFALSEVVYDGTVAFARRFLDRKSRTHDQMVQAARSGSRNIAEGSRASGTSKKTELKLIGVARASLDELLLDYESYLRQNNLMLWSKDEPKAVFIRNLSKRGKPESRTKQHDHSDGSDRAETQSVRVPRSESYSIYQPYIEEKSAETAANTLICLIHQTNFLLDRLLRSLEKSFVEQGGFTERLYRERTKGRKP